MIEGEERLAVVRLVLDALDAGGYGLDVAGRLVGDALLSPPGEHEKRRHHDDDREDDHANRLNAP